MAILKLNYGSNIANKAEVKADGAMSFATDTGYLYFGFNETTIKKPKKKYNKKKKVEEPVITEEIIEMKSEMIDENNYENIEVTQ